MLKLALFAALLAQDPAAAKLDQIVLCDGEVLCGRITKEVGSYVEIELQPGAVVGFRLAQVREIRRKAAQAQPVAAMPLPAADEWFVLHDAAGSPVGWLHGMVRPGPQGGVELSEEWEFVEQQRRTQVTILEVADADLVPSSCYFRERITENAQQASPLDPMATVQRVRGERILEVAACDDGWTVTRLCKDGRSARRIEPPRGALFPLLARALQQHGKLAGSGEQVVFDPALEELRTLSLFAVKARRVRLDGKERMVEESREGALSGANATWRDASLGTLRREVAGPGLVAVRADENTAKAPGARWAAPTAFAAVGGGQVGLWAPNPSWTLVEQDADAALLTNPIDDAWIRLVWMGQLDGQTTLDGSAQAALRWARLLHPSLVLVDQRPVRVRGRAAQRIDCTSGHGPGRTRHLFLVVATAEGFCLLHCSARAANFDELAADFAIAAGRLELEHGSVARLAEAAMPHDASPAATTAGGDATPRTGNGSSRAKAPRRGEVRVPTEALPAGPSGG
jgi:hypothetical protein